ncbi:Metallophosphoesterase domain-containing protein 1 [Labeo rohita]|uniref:Metallophosphoesterase domain-containing protein 1 n=1 Tax=Labeo rohita TaxID=84645 RepID=A0ABQ8MUF1_LABRO|nr:Metallophosphoesterase domain-containing protein 1 [Labeo rohita]
MAFTLSEIMAARRQQQQSQRGGRGVVEVDEYSANPTQAFTFYNINQGRFQPPHVHIVCVVDPVGDALKWAILIQNSAVSLRDPVDPLPHDTPKPPGYTRFVCISDTHSRTDTIQMPYGDVLLHAGDFTELGLPSEVKKFNDWLDHQKHGEVIVMTFIFLFTTLYTCACPKDEDGSVIKRIRRMTGVGNRKQEIWMDGWRLVSGVQETPVRLRLPLVCLIFFPAIDSPLSCLALSFWHGVPVPKRKFSRLFSRLSLYKYL